MKKQAIVKGWMSSRQEAAHPGYIGRDCLFKINSAVLTLEINLQAFAITYCC